MALDELRTSPSPVQLGPAAEPVPSGPGGRGRRRVRVDMSVLTRTRSILVRSGSVLMRTVLVRTRSVLMRTRSVLVRSRLSVLTPTRRKLERVQRVERGLLLISESNDESPL